jgi:uncharacterized protein with ParB-like and HNH nuclease domain
MRLLEADQVPVRSLLQYLSQPERILVIPPWQREYVWSATESGEVGVLLQDLKEFVDSDLDEYLMGSIILSTDPTVKFGEKQIIDGQQRTITFLIFLLAASKFLANAELKEINNLMHEELSQDIRKCLSFDLYDYRKRVSMNQQQANDALQSLFAWSKVADGELSDDFIADKEHWTETHRNIILVAEWLYEQQFKLDKWLPREKFTTAIRRILDGVKFIEISISNQQEAIAVFDRINDRGADLNSGDLIKNRIFMSVENDDEFAKITALWTNMNESLVQCKLKRIREPKFLLRALALADTSSENKVIIENEPIAETKFGGEKIPYEKLIRFWGDKLNPPKKEGFHGDRLDPVKFSDSLVEASIWLKSLSAEKSPKGWDLRDLYFTRYLKSVQHYPVLIAGRGIQNKAVYEHLVKQVHRRTAFYLLSDESTQGFESMIPKWTYQVARLSPDATIIDLEKIYNEPELKIAITKNQMVLLKEQFMSWSYKDPSEKKKIRAVLSQLSRIVDKQIKKEDSESPESYFRTRKNEDGKSWDIDHITPGGKEDKHSVYHLIGNLVLLHPNDNRSKKDAPAESKFDNYKDSRLYLTKTLAEVPIKGEAEKLDAYFSTLGLKSEKPSLKSWNEKSIKLRSEFYFALLETELMG